MNAAERKRIYIDLCDQGKIVKLFMKPWWLDATGPWEAALAMRNDRVVGAMPFVASRRWGIKTIGLSPLTHHSGIWMDRPVDISPHKWLTREKQIIWSLIDDLPKFGFFSMVFDVESFDNWLPFHWKGFRQEMRYTFIIKAAGETAIDQNLNRNLKRNIREAEGEVRIEKDVDPIAFYDLCKETFNRQKKQTPYSWDLFTKVDQAIYSHHAGVRLGAFNANQQLIAVSYLLWDEKTAYYFLAGDNTQGRNSGASILLCREALRIAFEERHVETFDFCGSMIEPITEIRRQFGARSVGLMKIVKSNYKLLDVLYSLTR